MKKCKFCREEIPSFNRKRTKCYNCVKTHPYKPAASRGTGGEPFNRKEIICDEKGHEFDEKGEWCLRCKKKII